MSKMFCLTQPLYPDMSRGGYKHCRRQWHQRRKNAHHRNVWMCHHNRYMDWGLQQNLIHIQHHSLYKQRLRSHFKGVVCSSLWRWCVKNRRECQEPFVSETPCVWNRCVTASWLICVCHWPRSQHNCCLAWIHQAQLQCTHPECHPVERICARCVGQDNLAIWTVDQCKKIGQIFQTFRTAEQLEEIPQAIHWDLMEFKLWYAGFPTATAWGDLCITGDK